MGVFWLWPDELIAVAFGAEYAAAAPLLLALGATRLVGYLAYMIALAGAAVNNFRMLFVYLPGLVIQAAVLTWWHASLSTMITGLLVVQVAVFVSMIVFAAYNARNAAGVRMNGAENVDPGGS